MENSKQFIQQHGKMKPSGKKENEARQKGAPNKPSPRYLFSLEIVLVFEFGGGGIGD